MSANKNDGIKLMSYTKSKMALRNWYVLDRWLENGKLLETYEAQLKLKGVQID